MRKKVKEYLIQKKISFLSLKDNLLFCIEWDLALFEK